MAQSDSSRPSVESNEGLPASRLIFIALVAITTCTTSFAQGSKEIKATFHLTASELEADEGDVVEFFMKDKAYRHPTTGEILPLEAHLSPVTWDFDDSGTDPAEDYGLYHIRHWFSSDNAGQPFVVKASHQGTTEEIEIRVRNVLPRINGVYMTPEPLPGKPTVFQAIARDPGYDDEVTFKWTFGDGGTATGRNVIHTYAREGDYPVTLEFADEQGLEDKAANQSGTFTINVKAGRDVPDENTISVSGDVSESNARITGVSIVGSNGNPMNPRAGGTCQVRLEMRTDRDDMRFTLTVQLNPGLAPGHYQVGNTREWDGMHMDDQRAQGTFFADFSPPRNFSDRDFNGLTVGGPFWSDGGRLSITRFDSGVLELDFEAELTENIPAEYDPRQVRVRGMLSTAVSQTRELGDVRQPSDLLNALQGVFGAGEQGDFNVNAYLCPGEEPGQFELVESAPAANAIGAAYENSGVSLRFSQVVDSDSVVNPETLSENLEIVYRGADGQHHHPRGGWVALPDNPTVVQFIPQSRLLPGTVYCVMVKGGEDGLRSFGGNVLGGSLLASPSTRMARACPQTNEDKVIFAFSTRVELQSVWVDLYQASLVGPHAELIGSGGTGTTARVYAWWRNVRNDIHATAQVLEFDANVDAFEDGVMTEGSCDDCPSTVALTIKRPDRYTAAERQRMDHTAQFFVRGRGPDSVEVSAAVEMKDERGRVLEPVVSSPTTRHTMRKPSGLSSLIYEVIVEGTCARGLTDAECGWGGESDESLAASITRAGFELSSTARRLLPIEGFASRFEDDIRRVETTRPCPGGFRDGFCQFDRGAGTPVDAMLIDPVSLANQIMQEFLDGSDYDARVNMVLAWVPPGFLPDPDNQPAALFAYPFPDPSVLFVQYDRFNPVALTAYIAWSLLDDEACLFDGSSFCDDTPVQGLGGVNRNVNKHHVEGNGESDRLIPLMQQMPWDEYNERDFHISAYNWGKLYEALKRRHDYANGASAGR